MKLEGSITFAGTQQEVYDVLLDPQALSSCIPGCQKMEPLGGDKFTAELTLGVSVIKGKYSANVQIADRNPPTGYKLIVDGKGGPGWVRATSVFTLVPVPEGTEVRYDIDAQVGGMIAAVGQRMLGSVAKMLFNDMFKCLQGQLAARKAGQ